MDQEYRACSVCNENRARNEYSKNQWKKGYCASKCSACIIGSSNDTSRCGAQQESQQQQPVTATAPSLGPRPQKTVGCLEGLTVCSDWPKTKSGQPPGAQSAVFMPLLACTMGEPIEGHYTAEQLQKAQLWWTAVLPSWPRWIQALRDAGVQTRCAELFLSSSSSIKGNPNPLIHKAKGHGTVPHLKGKIQRDLLELDPNVSWELDACINCLYTE